MTDLSKDEILAMAREAGAVFDPQWGIASNTGTATFERFATLCRAPLIAENAALKQAHEINADTLNAMQVEIDDWKARALKAEQVGEPFGWYSAKEDDFMLDKIRKTHERLNSHTHRIGKYDTALFTAPQPAAQEPFAWVRPDAVDVSQDFRFIKIDDFTVPLYTTPPSAVPVVRQMVVALDLAAPYFTHNNQVTAAIAAGQQYLKENGK